MDMEKLKPKKWASYVIIDKNKPAKRNPSGCQYDSRSTTKEATTKFLQEEKPFFVVKILHVAISTAERFSHEAKEISTRTIISHFTREY